MEQENKISSQSQKTRKWALASLICGALSVSGIFPPSSYGFFSFIFPIFAIIFGIIGLKKKEDKTFSIIGIILGSINIVITFLYFFGLFQPI